ncbi:MAG: hypothetical protein II954_01125 [Synergistaceae bacterium]|nr:hypothetical protein [Synergistaceae bacterium]
MREVVSMSAISAPRKMLIGLVLDMSEEKVPDVLDLVMREIIGYDEDEPPLTEDELRGIAIAEQELAEGKGIPFSQLMRELGE